MNPVNIIGAQRQNHILLASLQVHQNFLISEHAVASGRRGEWEGNSLLDIEDEVEEGGGDA